MPHTEPNQPAPPPSAPREAARFWERGRLLYNAILTVVVLLWLILTWPHFRPALTLGSFEVFVILGLLANLCYSAAYLAEFFIQLLAPGPSRRRARIALLVLGTIFAIVLENYWIADEIYPYANNPPPSLFAGAATMPTAFASNMNFPAPLAVLGFLAAIGGLFLAVASALIFWFARKPRFARIAAITTAAGAVVYFTLLLGFSAASHETVLAHGQEKYFCEIDCHLACAVLDAKTQHDGHFVITLRTRFDETTTSPQPPQGRALDSFAPRSAPRRQHRPHLRSRRHRWHSAPHPAQARRILHHATGIQSAEQRHRPPPPDQHHPAVARPRSHRRRKQLAPQENIFRAISQVVET